MTAHPVPACQKLNLCVYFCISGNANVCVCVSESVCVCVWEALLGLNEGCVSPLIGEQQQMITAVCVRLKETQRGANTTQMEDITTEAGAYVLTIEIKLKMYC